jgi:hypothetical protein
MRGRGGTSRASYATRHRSFRKNGLGLPERRLGGAASDLSPAFSLGPLCRATMQNAGRSSPPGFVLIAGADDRVQFFRAIITAHLAVYLVNTPQGNIPINTDFKQARDQEEYPTVRLQVQRDKMPRSTSWRPPAETVRPRPSDPTLTPETAAIPRTEGSGL